MNEHGNNNILTPPPEDYEVPEKRQKLETANSSTSYFSDNDSSYASKWERTLLMKELAACRTRLSDTEATSIYLREMRSEMEKAFIEKEGMLEMQARVEKDTIENLEARLEKVKKSNQEIDPEVIIKAELSPMERMMKEKIESLFAEDPNLSKHVLFVKSETLPSSKLQPEAPMEFKMEPILKEDVAPPESNLQDPRSEEVEIAAHKSKSVSSGTVVRERDRAFLVARANELEEQLQSAKNMISTLHEAAKGKARLEETVSMIKNKKKIKKIESCRGC